MKAYSSAHLIDTVNTDALVTCAWQWYTVIPFSCMHHQAFVTVLGSRVQIGEGNI